MANDSDTPIICQCRPNWEGHDCTVFTPAERALSDYVHRDDETTVLYDDEVKEAVAAVRPVFYREAAEAFHDMYAEGLPGRSPDFMQGLQHAADLLGWAADKGREIAPKHRTRGTK